MAKIANFDRQILQLQRELTGKLPRSTGPSRPKAWLVARIKMLQGVQATFILAARAAGCTKRRPLRPPIPPDEVEDLP